MSQPGGGKRAFGDGTLCSLCSLCSLWTALACVASVEISLLFFYVQMVTLFLGADLNTSWIRTIGKLHGAAIGLFVLLC